MLVGVGALSLFLVALHAGPARADTSLFSSTTPGSYSVSVPAGAASITITAVGGSGGNSSYGDQGGKGASVTVTTAVNPGDTLTVTVGANGTTSTYSSGACIGFPGGSGAGNGGYGSCQGAGGGGGSAVFDGATALAVAGGGGGGGRGYAGGNAGQSGGGCIDPFSCFSFQPGGQAGTQSAAGAGGSSLAVPSGFFSSTACPYGANGSGANGGNTNSIYGPALGLGGGGGGGYFGGGGGCWGGGGGGSSYPLADVTGLVSAAPSVTITYTLAALPVAASRLAYCSVAGNRTPTGSAIVPGTFLDLVANQPATDPLYAGAVPAEYVDGIGLTCGTPPPGAVATGERVGYGGHGSVGSYVYYARG